MLFRSSKLYDTFYYYPECEAGKWGEKCHEDCFCVPDNTDVCDPVNGNCRCKLGWSGIACEKDINECLTENECDLETEKCVNADGSYTCVCKKGLGRYGTECIG